jgi:arylsulfatase A-like enzyme
MPDSDRVTGPDPNARSRPWATICIGAGFGIWVALVEAAALHASSGMTDAPTTLALVCYGAVAFGIVALLLAATQRIAAGSGRLEWLQRPALVDAALVTTLLVARLLVDGQAVAFVRDLPSLAWLVCSLSASVLVLALVFLHFGRRLEITALAGIAAVDLPFLVSRLLGERIGGPWFATLAVSAVAGTCALVAACHFLSRRAVLALAMVCLVVPAAWRELAVTDPAAYTASSTSSSIPAFDAEDHMSLIMIVLDTVRADHLDLYGYTRETMPRLTAFARRGAVFEACVANSPWSLPTHATLMTGLHPREHHAVHAALPDGGYAPTPLAGEFTTLAELAREQGYQTAGFSANYGYVNPAFGLNQGFDDWDSRSAILGTTSYGYIPTLLRSLPILDKFGTRILLEPLVRFDIAQVTYRRAPEITTQATRWLASRAPRRPFFLFVNYMDAHDPYRAPGVFADYFPGRQPNWPRQPSPRFDFKDRPLDLARAHMASQYDSELAYLDLHLHRFLEALEARDLLWNTLIVITSDHGEQFLEHGDWGHGRHVYQDEIHVPLIIVDPELEPGRYDQTVDARDVGAWLIERLGLPRPGAVSESDLLDGDDAKVAELRGEDVASRLALRQGPMSLIRVSGRPDELYDLDRDPHQQHDLAEGQADAVTRLGGVLSAWTQSHATTTRAAEKLDATTEAQLRQLGYIE